MATTSNNAHAPAQDYDDEDEEEIYDEDLDEEGESDEDDDDVPSPSHSAGPEAVLRRLTEEEVRIRVHQVEIRGCGRTRRASVEAAVGPDLARAATVREPAAEPGIWETRDKPNRLAARRDATPRLPVTRGKSKHNNQPLQSIRTFIIV